MRKVLLAIPILLAACGPLCKTKPCGFLLIVSSPIQRDKKEVWPKEYSDALPIYPRVINPLRVTYQFSGDVGKKTEGRREVHVDQFGNLFIWFFVDPRTLKGDSFLLSVHVDGKRFKTQFTAKEIFKKRKYYWEGWEVNPALVFVPKWEELPNGPK